MCVILSYHRFHKTNKIQCHDSAFLITSRNIRERNYIIIARREKEPWALLLMVLYIGDVLYKNFTYHLSLRPAWAR